MFDCRAIPLIPGESEQQVAPHVNGVPFLGPILTLMETRLERRSDGTLELTTVHHSLEDQRAPEFPGDDFPVYGAE
jgi:hypothetical protein